MTYDLDAPVLDLDGNQMSVKTYKDAIFLVLTTGLPDDAKLNLETRMKIFGLVTATHSGGALDFSAEDVVLIKRRASNILADVVLLGRLVNFLEGVS